MTDLAALAAFLTARIDEDEAAAKAWLPFGNPDAPAREHIARYDPGRVLREVEANRRILAEFQAQDGDPWSADADYFAGLVFVVKALAGVYSSHPDYRQEWTS